MSTKRKPDTQVPAEESDHLIIRPLWVCKVFDSCKICFNNILFIEAPVKK